MTTWKRLRIVQVQPETDAQRLQRLAAAITSGRDLTDDERQQVASYLRRLADSSKALAALTRQRGAPRTSLAPYIALDYLVQKELLGKSAAAWTDVANAWCDGKEGTVKDAWTDWKAFARWKLGELTNRPLGTRSREQLLRDISGDLRESHAARGRDK